MTGSLWEECGTSGWSYVRSFSLPNASLNLPATVQLNLAGTLVTTERMVPETPEIVVNGGTSTHKPATLRYFWNNTMPSSSVGNLTNWSDPPSYPTQSISSPVPAVPQNVGPFPAYSGDEYTSTITSSSRLGGYNSTQNPGISANEAFSSPKLTTAYSCTFTLGNNPITMSSLSVANISGGPGGTASVSWTASVDGTGYVSYFEVGVATNFTQTATVTGSVSTHHYYVQLHALGASSLFYIVGFTSLGNGCLTFQQNSTKTFNTLGRFQLHETDLAYDSITGQGGGATLTWQMPANITGYALVNASVVLVNNTAYPTWSVYPITNFSQMEPTPGNFLVNLTPSNLNMSYSVEAFLNFSDVISGHTLYWNFTSYLLTFIYEKDSSGDGLTDAEKLRGWLVPGPGGYGGISYTPPGGIAEQGSFWVTANPAVQDTNGLVSDFLEKEFALDPNTVDTAGSNMLDTWNLTFDIGTHQIPSIAKFHYWGENGTYNPFATAQYPGGPVLSGPLADPTNKTQDNSTWDAEVLWPFSDLQKFVNYSGVQAASWLRGVFGNTSSGERTLTLWGKLSWGANPHVSSTPGDSWTDGSRVNPVAAEAIQLYVGNFPGGVVGGGFYVNPNDTSGQCGTLPHNAGVALRFYAPGAPNGLGGNNYSAQFLTGCHSSQYSNGTQYTTTIPVTDQTVGAQRIALQMWANVSTNSAPDPFELSVAGCNHWTYNFSVDMLNATAVTPGGHPEQTLWGSTGTCGGSPARTEIAFGWTEVPVGVKSKTYLWVPDGNGTISSLPDGLAQYTGAESFGLVVVNNQAGGNIVSAGVPLPWGGSTSGLTVNNGLNTFVVPTSQLMSSPFGEAILLNRSIPNGTLSTSLLSSSNGGAILNTPSAATNAMLACYWQDRAVSSSPYICSSNSWSGSGTTRNTSLAVTVSAATGCDSSNCGGLATDPGLFNTSDAGAALSSIITLNLTDPYGSNSQVLDALLAGLIDNTTGGVNGTFIDITGQVQSLGLPSIVVNAISNVTYASGGLYAAPYSKATPPAPTCPWYNPSCWNWAAATAIIGDVLVGIAFSVGIAAILYIVLGPHWMSDIGGALLRAAASAYAAAADVIEQGIAWLIQAAMKVVETVVGQYISVQEVINALVTPYASAVASALTSSGGGLSSPSASWGTSLFNHFLATVLGYGNTILIVLSLVMAISTALTFGAGAIASFAISYIASLLLPDATSRVSPNPSSSTESVGLALPVASVHIAGNFSNLTATAAGVNPTSSQAQQLDTTLGSLASAIGLSGSIVGLFGALGLYLYFKLPKATNLLPVLNAALGLGLTCLSIILVTYLYSTTNPYSKLGTVAGEAINVAAAAIGILGLIFGSFGVIGALASPSPQIKQMARVFGLAVIMQGISEACTTYVLVRNLQGS